MVDKFRTVLLAIMFVLIVIIALLVTIFLPTTNEPPRYSRWRFYPSDKLPIYIQD